VIVDQLVNYLPLNLGELLPNLKKLAVINSSLIAIKKNELKGFDQLEELNLSANVIEELPSEAFASIKNLKHLNMSHNALTNINDDLFAPENRVETIDFDHNKISKVSRKFFRNLKALKAANFKENECINGTSPAEMQMRDLRMKVAETC